MSQTWINQRLTTAELDAIQDKALSATHYATMVKYDHGGARIGVLEGDEHQLVAYIYNEVDRNFFEVATPETVLRLVEQARAMEWKPIETAPKDGSFILVFCLGSLAPAAAKWCSHCNRWEEEDCKEKYDEWPITHWMPLPKPPEAK